MKFSPYNRAIWLITVSFVLFQFLLQMSSGLVMSRLMTEVHLSAFAAGLLSAAFYLIYTPMQIPVGILFDYQNTRKLLSFSACVCALGCLMFAMSYQVYTLFLGRLLMGAGASFAFVGLSLVVRRLFPIHEFGFWIGLSEMIGLGGIIISTFFLGTLITYFGWRPFLFLACAIGLVISGLCYFLIPNNQLKTKLHFNKQSTLAVLTHPLLWLNGIILGLSFSVISVFGGMWAIPYFQHSLGFDMGTASRVTSLIFLGTAVSCPVFGKLSLNYLNRRKLMIGSSLVTALWLCILLYAPITNAYLAGSLMLLIGLSCGAYMLTFTIANELAPKEALATSAGFTNTLGMVTAPLFQPAIGFLLDITKNHALMSTHAYPLSLSILPLALVLAALLTVWLPSESS